MEIERIISRLNDIYKSIIIINKKMHNVSCEELCDEKNLELQSVIAWKLTIIGEASSVLLKKYPEFCRTFSDINLKSCKRMRNLLVHEYNVIDWVFVFNECHQTLTQLIDPLNKVLKLSEADIEYRIKQKCSCSIEPEKKDIKTINIFECKEDDENIEEDSGPTP